MVTLENGKSYQTVAERLQAFRATHPAKDGWGIVTTVEFPTLETVRVRAEIFDPDKRLIATGHSEERRSDSSINMTSAVENAETSAIGRALFAAGFGNGEFCSADELMLALKAQADLKAKGKGGDPWTKSYDKAPETVPETVPETAKETKPIDAQPPASVTAPVQEPAQPAKDASPPVFPAIVATANGPKLPSPPPDVEWKVSEETVVATGKGTFNAKESLKSMGFRWNKEGKVWEVQISKLMSAEAEPQQDNNGDEIPF